MDKGLNGGVSGGFTLLSVSDVALMLRVKPVTVIRLVKKGELPAQRVGKKFLFTDGDMAMFLNTAATPRKGEKNACNK